MKNLTFLKFMAVFFISLFFINETNAQCKPDAGVDTATCGLVYNLDATAQNGSATAQWTVYSKPAGSSVVFGDGSTAGAQLFNTDASVNAYGVYEFVIEESLGACSDYDTILIEFIRNPQISAGNDQYICGWRAQMEAIVDPSGTSVAGNWVNAPVYWTDSVFWNTTPDTTMPIVLDTNQQYKPNAYITLPITLSECEDTLMMIWNEYSIGTTFTNYQCFSKDTVMLYFYADIQADNIYPYIEPDICGREIQLVNPQEMSCATGYWIDSLNSVIDWDPSNSTQNTTATVANYGTNAFAYIIENGHVPGSGYPVCSDTSEFVTVTFLQEPQVDACASCYRLENTTLPNGQYVESVRTDTVCLNDYNDFYQLNPYSNIGTGYWTYSSAGIIFANNDGTIAPIANDSVYAMYFNSSINYPSNYYTLVWTSYTSNGCDARDTLLLSLAKNPSAEIGFLNPYSYNTSATIWAEEDIDADPTQFNWTLSDNPIIDSTVVSTPDSIYYPRWNQSHCDSLIHTVSLQTSSDWGCYSLHRTVIVEVPEVLTPLTNNTLPTFGMNDGVIRIVTDSVVGCDGPFQYSYNFCWLNSTLQEDSANNIPSFDAQINYGANCMVDSLYGLTANDSCWIIIDYVSLITVDTGSVIYKELVEVKDTIMLKIENSTLIKEIDTNDFISIYPNPATNQLTINWADKINADKIEIFDISGKLISIFIVDNNTQYKNLNISKLKEGIYFVKLGNYTSKFIKIK